MLVCTMPRTMPAHALVQPPAMLYRLSRTSFYAERRQCLFPPIEAEAVQLLGLKETLGLARLQFREAVRASMPYGKLLVY